ncbi:hypothetical protein HK096_006750 [Nowakowskiella sp. JEL0078]|nr:hypothetical protein HK096_006750 [Nowakowskiella sp. JEL0078]
MKSEGAAENATEKALREEIEVLRAAHDQLAISHPEVTNFAIQVVQLQEELSRYQNLNDNVQQYEVDVIKITEIEKRCTEKILDLNVDVKKARGDVFDLQTKLERLEVQHETLQQEYKETAERLKKDYENSKQQYIQDALNEMQKSQGDEIDIEPRSPLQIIIQPDLTQPLELITLAGDEPKTASIHELASVEYQDFQRLTSDYQKLQVQLAKTETELLEMRIRVEAADRKARRTSDNVFGKSEMLRDQVNSLKEEVQSIKEVKTQLQNEIKELNSQLSNSIDRIKELETWIEANRVLTAELENHILLKDNELKQRNQENMEFSKQILQMSSTPQNQLIDTEMQTEFIEEISVISNYSATSIPIPNPVETISSALIPTSEKYEKMEQLLLRTQAEMEIDRSNLKKIKTEYEESQVLVQTLQSEKQNMGASKRFIEEELEECKYQRDQNEELIIELKEEIRKVGEEFQVVKRLKVDDDSDIKKKLSESERKVEELTLMLNGKDAEMVKIRKENERLLKGNNHNQRIQPKLSTILLQYLSDLKKENNSLKDEVTQLRVQLELHGGGLQAIHHKGH